MSPGVTAATRAVTLYVGTQKGLFRLRPDKGHGAWQLDGPFIAGYEVIHTCTRPRHTGELYAAASHPVWGAHIYRSTDGGDGWEPMSAVPHHAPGRHDPALKAIWYLAWTPDGRRLYAGIDPAGLFVSADGGQGWQPVAGLNEHPTSTLWEPSRGIFAVHSVYIDPREGHDMVAAVSAGGVYRSEDGGDTWQPANRGVRAENLPQRFPVAGHNVHRLLMHPREPTRLYRQCYNGTYRSDDGGLGWTEITAGLPSDFGYAIASDPNDPNVVYQIPESSAQLRTTVDGKLRVYRSRDAGASWESASRGLPQSHAYVTVLREAMDTDGASPCGVYFGTSSGHLFASADGGDTWHMIAGFLPRILSVRAERQGA